MWSLLVCIDGVLTPKESALGLRNNYHDIRVFNTPPNFTFRVLFLNRRNEAFQNGFVRGEL